MELKEAIIQQTKKYDNFYLYNGVIFEESNAKDV